ncbi:GMC family oxidoreductase [Agrobacterium sp. LAD9]|uniref:GMC family oxidoreductase n=1 Tax=Agrobacterium sp. LAD9 TaxID=2055153 RepID=UPI000D1D685C|nr:GMC family oxidoreductase N-terminal domain-containing protein [Agrobacterium sp. LAD9]
MTAEAAQESFDYIIIGGGSAGSLLAERLSEDGRSRVCVLESGPTDWHPFVSIPAGYIKILFDPKMTWGFPTEASAGTNSRSIVLPQGRMLGGSSSINGMVYSRGQPGDFDEWARRGNAGWGYDDILPYFKRTERRIGDGDDRYRGRTGALPVTDLDGDYPLCEIFADGAETLGLPRNRDYNGATQFGTGYSQRVIYRGRRVNAATAFLKKARKRPNVEIRTHTHVTRILLTGKRATGVRYLKGGEGGQPVDIHATREIILSAGAINSPKVLQLSGIGDAGLLNGLGISVTHDLPGVGENFRDHYAARLVARVKNIPTLNSRARGIPLGLEILKWALGRPSIISVTPAMFYAFGKSSPELDAPDIQCSFTPASYKEGYLGVLEDYPGVTCGPYQQRPESQGYVRIRATEPFEKPVVQPNYLADPLDQRVIVAGIRIARKLLTSPAMRPYFDCEEIPGPDCQTDEELLDFARSKGSTAYHLIGTCRMGKADDHLAVVDDQLRVHGISGLRVVDASVMPTMPSANTYASTLMIAEKAADMIRGLAPLSPVI